jgi:hypothetical protein
MTTASGKDAVVAIYARVSYDTADEIRRPRPGVATPRHRRWKEVNLAPPAQLADAPLRHSLTRTHIPNVGKWDRMVVCQNQQSSRPTTAAAPSYRATPTSDT